MSDALNVPYIHPGLYRHYKNKMYEVIGTAIHSETQEALVIYKPLYDSDAEYWVRPYDMFIGKVEVNGLVLERFEKIDD